MSEPGPEAADLVERMAMAAAEQAWRDLSPVGDPAQAWAKCPEEARERWRAVVRATAREMLAVLRDPSEAMLRTSDEARGASDPVLMGWHGMLDTFEDEHGLEPPAEQDQG